MSIFLSKVELNLLHPVNNAGIIQVTYLLIVTRQTIREDVADFT